MLEDSNSINIQSKDSIVNYMKEESLRHFLCFLCTPENPGETLFWERLNIIIIIAQRVGTGI